ncbi:MAG TPA: ParA family protein [Anaeromyxobacter sp.]|nr:ParA family protein [Anaeromyxobacter sp.]
MRRIAFFNEKGGTCKTTLCVNVAARMAARGRRVLLVDLDTQGHAGKSLGVDVRRLRPTVHEWLLGEEGELEGLVRPTPVPGIDLVPANKDLAAFPVLAAPLLDRADRLDRRLEALPQGRYDLVLIDAPPSQSLLTENALRAARELVLPVAVTYLALDGCAEVLDSLVRLRAERGRAPELTLVVATLYRRTQLADEILAKLRERFPATLSPTVLGWSVRVDEAQSHGRTIFEHAPGSSGARALARIADEILERAPPDRP